MGQYKTVCIFLGQTFSSSFKQGSTLKICTVQYRSIKKEEKRHFASSFFFFLNLVCFDLFFYFVFSPARWHSALSLILRLLPV